MATTEREGIRGKNAQREERQRKGWGRVEEEKIGAARDTRNSPTARIGKAIIVATVWTVRDAGRGGEAGGARGLLPLAVEMLLVAVLPASDAHRAAHMEPLPSSGVTRTWRGSCCGDALRNAGELERTIAVTVV